MAQKFTFLRFHNISPVAVFSVESHEHSTVMECKTPGDSVSIITPARAAVPRSTWPAPAKASAGSFVARPDTKPRACPSVPIERRDFSSFRVNQVLDDVAHSGQ